MTQPNDSDFDDSISMIEDLDPEPAREPKPVARADLMLGILLIVGIVLFAGWLWWYQGYQSSQYQAGRDAANRSDLDSALHYFLQASGYNDADALAKSTQQQINERDRLYDSAKDYADKGQWLPALRDIRAAAKIEPDYKDLSEREETALDNVYMDALSGTIALRDTADPPGFYYRSPSGWVWLQGSDTRTVIFSSREDGHIIYDVPNTTLTTTPTPNPGTVSRASDTYRGRLIMSAEPIGNSLRFTQMPIDPSYFLPFVAGKEGLWALHYVNSTGVDNQPNPVVHDPLPASETVYQPYSGEVGATVKMTATEDISTGSSIVAIDPDSNRYLLAEWTGAHSYGPSDATIINLYLCAAGESTRRLVYTQYGGSLQSASVSPDGRYLLVHKYEEYSWGSDTYQTSTVLLVDLDGDGQEHMLATAYANANPWSGPIETLASAFIDRGAYAGKLLLVENEYDVPLDDIQSGSGHATARIIDPAKAMTGLEADYAVADAPVDGSIDYTWRVVEQNGDGLMLMGRSLDNGLFTFAQCALILFQPGREPEVYKAGVTGDGEIQAAATTNCHIAWAVREYEGQGMRLPALSVFSLHRTYNSDSTAGPQQIYTTRDARDSSDPPWNVLDSVNMGDRLMAYAKDGELHARSYDGQVDLVLESGVVTISNSLTFSYYAGVLR